VADIINAVGTSPCQNPDTSSYWNTTAIFVVWDDWGGFWDHVDPNGTGGPGVHFNCTNWGCGYTYGVPCAPAGGFGVYICGLRFRQHPKPRRNVPLRPRLWQHLAFIENNFNLGIGNINAQNQYLFADAHAPDGANGNIPLADFFPLTTPRTFERINVPAAWQTFDANYFLNYTGPILDPDNDAIDND